MWVRRKGLRWLNDLTPFQLIAVYYLLAVTISSILIALPVAHQDGVKLDFIDILFTAVSAVSVTGLTTVPTAETFSTTGIFIIAIVLQLGGDRGHDPRDVDLARPWKKDRPEGTASHYDRPEPDLLPGDGPACEGNCPCRPTY